MNNPNSPDNPFSIQPDTLALKEKARQEGLETVWERHAAQEPVCGFCDLGLSCRICVMGPCRVVGCNNPKITQDYGHINLTKRLIEADILVLDTGCAAVAHAKAGFKTPEAAALAGPGLQAVCQALGVPPVLHMGSCVDNTRIVNLAAILAGALGVDLDQLPVAAAAPEWYSEKAATIACYAVASGIFTVLGVAPPILGSAAVTDLLLNGLEPHLGAKFAVQPDPIQAPSSSSATSKASGRALGAGLPATPLPGKVIDKNPVEKVKIYR